jgi:hypothetical protein
LSPFSDFVAVGDSDHTWWAEIQSLHLTGIDAGWLLSSVDEVNTKIALGHPSGLNIILWRPIRTAPLTVAAAKASFLINDDNSIGPFAYCS